MEKNCRISVQGPDTKMLSEVVERLGRLLSDIGYESEIVDNFSYSPMNSSLNLWLSNRPEEIERFIKAKELIPKETNTELASLPHLVVRVEFTGKQLTSKSVSGNFEEQQSDINNIFGFNLDPENPDKTAMDIVRVLEGVGVHSGDCTGYTREEEDLIARRLRDLGYL